MNRRKELQNEYGMKKRRMGVYAITNTSNGKRYIASTSTLDSAWQREQFVLTMGSHANKALQTDWSSSELAKFEYEELEALKLGDEIRNDYKDIMPGSAGVRRNVVQSYRDELRKLELKWLEKFQAYEPDGYNRRPRQN
ncbi:GIY-YIG nuclease family protein [Paenibacillus oenotherae]|uniref:GIY-YIG nuclease family protein n=1 Tax=Paenibacillus oenotherae TaxID=1435645 RepID=A0ABS7DA93_9BACL|nr:GIY-YIG nuclease family protein [Paenibacillus oenotherae]MBW7476855.1 GIY-YIG nuclease family protein [Paenibacillus oenotherae]